MHPLPQICRTNRGEINVRLDFYANPFRRFEYFSRVVPPDNYQVHLAQYTEFTMEIYKTHTMSFIV